MMEVTPQVEHELFRLANVVGVGIGKKNNDPDGDICFVVSVSKKLPETALRYEDIVPKMIFGYKTDVVETGIIRALSTERERPAFGGDSIGHVDVTAGTLGCVVRRGDVRVILSNNHVMANSNDAEIGDPIVQPGTHDGGVYPEDHIADLTDYVEVSYIGLPSECPVGTGLAALLNTFAALFRRHTRLRAMHTAANDEEGNLVDAAIATPVDDEMVTEAIREVGAPEGVAEAVVDGSVKKTGRTSGHTQGTVTQVGVTVNVQFGLGRIATFRDQVISDIPSEPGDSGSAILDDGNHLVGLLFAGSDQITVFNRIQNVFNELELSL